MEKIGFIGLGKMGLPMALNLCRAGYEVLVCSRNPESARQVEELGGRRAASYADLAREADVVITIVPADREIEELYLSENGLLENMRDGTVCIDMTSALGSTMRRLQERVLAMGKDIRVVDAPVSGGVAGAVSGKLTIMVGCESRELLEQVLPILKAMGEKIFFTGGLGSGSDIKMINQMINAANVAVAAEAVTLADRLGVDLNTLVEVVCQSSGGSYIFERNVPKYMLTHDHTPGFRLNLMEKDVRLCMTAAAENRMVLPVCDLVYQIYRAASNQGKGEKNYTAVQEWVESNQAK